MPPRTSPSFGHVEGVKVGARLSTLFELKQSGVHCGSYRIHPRKDGVCSIIIGNEDVDEGSEIMLKLTPSKKSALKKKPHHLLECFMKNYEDGTFIRVVRSSNKGGQYSPLLGYRYDGLYTVTGIHHDQVTSVLSVNLQSFPNESTEFPSIPLAAKRTGGGPTLREITVYKQLEKIYIPNSVHNDVAADDDDIQVIENWQKEPKVPPEVITID